MIGKDTRVARQRRQARVRRRVRGTDARPRLCVFRSNKYLYVQVISDESGRTLAAASTLSGEAKGAGADRKAAKQLGAIIGKLCRDRGITDVVFDRNGYLYHGRVKTLAEAAREAGLQF